jgi:cysteine sulfinate desulfinase/cysteine desulfurase-like protein
MATLSDLREMAESIVERSHDKRRPPSEIFDIEVEANSMILMLNGGQIEASQYSDCAAKLARFDEVLRAAGF